MISLHNTVPDGIVMLLEVATTTTTTAVAVRDDGAYARKKRSPVARVDDAAL